MEVEFRRDERPPEPAEEILNWSVQVPLDHQLTFGELSEALHLMRLKGVVNEAHVQIHGNLIMAWMRLVVVA